MSTTYTPAQMKCIEENRDFNVDHNMWADDMIAEFCRECSEFGLTIKYETRNGRNGATYQEPIVHWSGFWSQGDGASFEAHTFTIAGLIESGRKVMEIDDGEEIAYVKTSDSPVPTALRALFRYVEDTYGACMLSARHAEVLGNCEFLPGLYNGNYSHSGTMQLGVQNDIDSDSLADAPKEYQKWVASVEDEGEHLRNMLTDIADALYQQLETEYEYQTTDEAVWESIEANDLFDASDYEDEDEEVALAA